MPLTSLASILLQEMPAEVLNPVSACMHVHRLQD